jgi:hypothetical protein
MLNASTNMSTEAEVLLCPWSLSKVIRLHQTTKRIDSDDDDEAGREEKIIEKKKIREDRRQGEISLSFVRR